MPRSTPSYKGLKPASEAASKAKRANRAKNTKAEVLLRRELWTRGHRYRIHRADLPGKPDIVFPGARLVVFVDGDFWHGRNWSERKPRVEKGANGHYWVRKIETNIARDAQQVSELEARGWRVLRLWETDVLSSAIQAALEVEKLLKTEAVR